MVYIYRKKIGNKEYYYLRASVKKDGKQITKDIAYLGNDITKIEGKLSKYSKEIRKTYKTIQKFLEVNHYLNEIKNTKIKKESILKTKILEDIESCKLHWEKKYKKLHELTQKEYLFNFIIEFAYNSTSIEGNTITLKEARNLLHENLSPKNRTLREIYDLQNTHKVFQDILSSKKNISHSFIQDIHNKLLVNIDNRIGYRTQDVRIFKMNFKSTPAKYVKADMELLIKWYNENRKKFHPFVLGCLFHHKFEKIHPFFDGNGRTGRILFNYILIKEGYPPIIIRKKNRTEYLNELNKADKIPLTESKGYSSLIEFVSYEYVESYWNLFL